MKQERVLYFDVVKGFAILLMIIGHCSIPSGFHDWIYSWHMPVFFLISGYFLKQEGWKKTLLSIWKHQVVPYWVICISVLICLFLIQLNHFFNKEHFLAQQLSDAALFAIFGNNYFSSPREPYLGIVWFICALAWCKIWMRVSFYFPGKIRLLFFVLLFCLPGTILDYKIFDWFYILQGMQASIFVYLGMLMRGDNLYEKKPIVIPFILLFFASKMPIHMYSFYYPYGIYSVIVATLISISVIFVSKYLTENEYFRRFRLLELFCFVGKYSILIYCYECFAYSMQYYKVIASLPLWLNVSIKLIIPIVIVSIAVQVNFVRRIFSLR